MKTPEKQPKWLEETQNNSWNPELLISGISILFIFTIADRLDDFAIGIIQDHAINPTFVFVSLLYITMAMEALKYAFVFHLVLRGVWIGLVGLNYVYPNGIVKEKLPKMSQKKFFLEDLTDNVSNIMRVERICSSIFSIAFSVVGISAWIMVFIIPAAIINAMGVHIKWVLLFLLVVLALVSLSISLHQLLSNVLKREEIPVLKHIYMAFSRMQYWLFFRESFLVFQTNWNPRVAAVILGFGAFGFGILSHTQIRETTRFIKEALPMQELIPGFEPEPQEALPYPTLDARFYQDLQNDAIRVQKATIPSYVAKDQFLQVFQAGFDWDDEVIEADTALKIHQLATVYLNGDKKETVWRYTEHPHSGQAGWITHLDIDSLDRGPHTLLLDRWVWHFHESQPIFYEGWCEITFLKE